MSLRLLGLVATGAAVLLLLGSLVAGMIGGGGGDPADPASAARGEGPAPAARVRVEVLNASGRAGLARAATERLRARGFDVVFFGNASGFPPDSSLVLDRVGREERARSVADALDVPTVRSRPDTTLYVDVTVVLGRDWAGIPRDTAAADSAG